MAASLVQSENPCPLCGGREWQCYVLGFSTPELMLDDDLVPFVDCEDLDTLHYRGERWVDECLTCGAVAS